MKNKLFEVFVCMLLIGTFFVVNLDMVSADLVDGDYTYFVQNGESTITGYIGAGGAITIPSTIGGHPTVAIEEFAFKNCTSLTSVIIPNNVTTIGYAAFESCTSLNSVTIPNSVTYIGGEAFYRCTSLPSVTIGSGVTTIGYGAFHECLSMTAINVNVNNVNYASVDGILYNKTMTTLIQYPLGKAEPLIIPNGVINIEERACFICQYITSVFIPDSVTTIGNCSFNGCNNMTSVSIGSGVTTIEEMAFQSCTSLVSATIPDSVITIGVCAFRGCGDLTSVNIGSGVTTIGMRMFEGCQSLTSVTIPGNVTTIGASAFIHCSSLSSINFLGLVAPAVVGEYWIDGTSRELRGHAYATSNFPPPGGAWNGLMMGTVISRENEPPIASFTWMPSNPTLDQTITFDASASTDLDGSLTLYEWDWNNDGVYEESHATPTVTYSWSLAGNYSVTVRVTDNNGSTSTKTITVPVNSGGGGGNGDTDNKGTPGFELVIVIGALALIFFWKRKSKK